MTYIPFPLAYPPDRARERIAECMALLNEPGKVKDVTARALYWRAMKSAHQALKESAAPSDCEPA